jgi:hypothetical protein
MNNILKVIKDIRTKRPVVWFGLYLGFICLVAVAATYWSEYIGTIAYVWFIVVLLIATLVTWLMAALAVFRSLLIVGAGLSLLLYVAQEYCALPIQERIADDSLQSLIGIGIIFMLAIFAFRLYKELFGDLEAKNEFHQKGALKVFRESNKGKDPWFILLLYALFLGLILSQVFQVLYPIFSNLCVYR